MVPASTSDVPMNNYRIEFRIGVVALVALATLVLLVVWFGKQSIVSFGDGYTLLFRFQSVPGVKVNTPVIKNGVQIGRVTKITLVDGDREVEVAVRLPNQRKVYSDEECRVRQRMIMGDSTLEFVKKRSYSGPIDVISPDSPPQVGAAAVDILGGFANIEGNLQRTITNVGSTAQTLDAFIGRINALVGSPEELKKQQAEIQETVREIMDTMRSLRQLADGAGSMFNDSEFQTNSKKIVQELPDILHQSRSLLADSDTFLKELRGSVARGTTTLDKVDQRLDNLKQWGDDASNALKALQSAAENADSFVNGVKGTLRNFADSDSPFLERVLQPEVADNLRTTIANVRSITEQFDLLLRNDVKPITHNVKIITDKVARDPSVFVRNLIRRQPPIKQGLPIWGDGLGSDRLDSECIRLETIEDEEYPLTEPTLSSLPTLSPLPRRTTTLSARLLSFFSVPKSIAIAQPSVKRQQVPGPMLEESQGLEPTVVDEPPLALLPPKLEPPLLPQNDVIPAAGRIVCVDPRYAKVDLETPYQQMSWQEPSDVKQEPSPSNEARLVFSRP